MPEDVISKKIVEQNNNYADAENPWKLLEYHVGWNQTIHENQLLYVGL